MKSQSGTNKSCQPSIGETAFCFWIPEALGVEPVSGSGKRWNGSCVLCPPPCSLYGVLLPTQDSEARGKRTGWVLACAVRDYQVLHILFLWEMEAGNHQVSYFNDNGVKSMGIPYSGCHFRKFAYSVLYPLCFVPA